MKFISYSILALFIFCSHPTWLAASNYGLQDAFDREYTYKQTIFVSPGGSDGEGDGSQASPYRTLQRAANEAKPGTEILLLAGNHVPGQRITNLQGTPSDPICIRGLDGGEPAVFSGGSTAIQLSDPKYLVLENVHIQNSSGNGLNIDDGGSYATPAEYVILRHLTVKDIGPSGNRDGIKLSGLDRFRVENCLVDSPGDSGSAIDMVGCHDGFFLHNTIQNFVHSGIQAKGGSAEILIYANRFEGGWRAINMGGSTGLPYFRPMDATAEANHITVWANLFIENQAPIAFVGCENGLFAQNTIYRPTKWIARILQENTGDRFISCRNNVFANNLVVFDTQVKTFVNIGPNTKPSTFVFSHNLWFDEDDSNFSALPLPVTPENPLIQMDPGLRNAASGDFHLRHDSPAIAAGGDLAEIVSPYSIEIPDWGDYGSTSWGRPPSIGAFEGVTNTDLEDWSRH